MWLDINDQLSDFRSLSHEQAVANVLCGSKVEGVRHAFRDLVDVTWHRNNPRLHHITQQEILLQLQYQRPVQIFNKGRVVKSKCSSRFKACHPKHNPQTIRGGQGPDQEG